MPRHGTPRHGTPRHDPHTNPTAQVVREGEVNLNLFFIHRGVVTVWKRPSPPEGQPQREARGGTQREAPLEGREVLATLSANDFFGETSLMSRETDSTDYSGGSPVFTRSVSSFRFTPSSEASSLRLSKASRCGERSLRQSTVASTSPEDSPAGTSRERKGAGATASVECVSYCELLVIHKASVQQHTSQAGNKKAIKTAISQGVQDRQVRAAQNRTQHGVSKRSPGNASSEAQPGDSPKVTLAATSNVVKFATGWKRGSVKHAPKGSEQENGKVVASPFQCRVAPAPVPECR